jgi:hypothetical protein
VLYVRIQEAKANHCYEAAKEFQEQFVASGEMVRFGSYLVVISKMAIVELEIRKDFG